MKSSAFCLYCGKPGGDSIVKHPKTAPFRVRAQGEKTGEQAKMKNLRECVTRFICATVDRNEITLHLIENMKFTYDQNKLTILATPEEMAEIRETRSDNPRFFGCDDHQAEVMEPLICNSELDWTDSRDTGDLTDAPILCLFGEDVKDSERANFQPGVYGWRHIGNDGNEDYYQPILSRWGYPHYAVRSFLSDLADTGKAEFLSQW